MKEPNLVRNDMNCTECGRNFIAQLDMSLDGNHVVQCPWCEHEHCRVIKGGIVTEDRFDHRQQRINVQKMCVWKSASAPIITSIASHFIREKWLNLEDLQL